MVRMLNVKIFFAFYRDKVTGKSNYDAIVGNPPFIRYQDFDEKIERYCIFLHERKWISSDKIN